MCVKKKPVLRLFESKMKSPATFLKADLRGVVVVEEEKLQALKEMMLWSSASARLASVIAVVAEVVAVSVLLIPDLHRC